MAEFEINLKLSETPTSSQIKKLEKYFKEIPLFEILSGLKFANNRWIAKDAGILKVGRKSILQKETHSVTTEQAQWRLKNWKNILKKFHYLKYYLV